MGPITPFAEELHAEKYRGEGESFKEGVSRVAAALKDDDTHYRTIRDILLDMRFLPAGRIQAAMGSTRHVTPYNCFVSGTIEDSFIEGSGNIMERATQAAATMRMGGGIGYDFSTLRPRGALIRKLQSRSSGPVSFMDIYDAICRCVASSGHRRGAQMGVLRVDHPDIEEFVHSKQNHDKLTGFNISVALTDEFMRAVEHGGSFDLKWNGEVYKTIDAANLWETIMRSTWDWAEPGVLFIDRINEMNNLYYCETIAATNPCGEQPLPPHGACLLGSFNLTKYISVFAGPNEVGDPGAEFNWVDFMADIPPIVAAMDNVVDRAIYPMEQQKVEAQSKRRMGLGITGLANTAEVLGFPYGSREFLEFEAQVLETLCLHSYQASIKIADKKGSFPLYDTRFTESKFIKTLPEELAKDIRKYGIRNSHLTSIAPTGTISLCADNVSSGIEPVFAYQVERQVFREHGPEQQIIEDYGFKNWHVKGKRVNEVSAAEHLDVLTIANRFVDSAVSKTCNVSSKMPWEEFKNIYLTAWRNGCKGCTTYQVGGKRGAIMETKEEDSSEAPSLSRAVNGDEPTSACFVDPLTGRKECT